MATTIGAGVSVVALGWTGYAPALAAAFPVPSYSSPATPAPPANMPLPQSAASVDSADYYWIDNADALADAIGDAPPDFTFAFDGGEPWGWRTGTGHEIYAEPLGDGAIRYYYFEPGNLVPFVVQDARYTFGYRNARLAVVYDSDGRVLPRAEGDFQMALATRLYARGRALRDAAQYEDAWEAIDAGYWAQQIPTVIQIRLRWSTGRSRYAGWQRWRGQPGSARWRGSLAGERDWRWAAGDRFRRWQRDGFQGPPPRFGENGRPGRGMRPPRRDGQPWLGRPPRPGQGQPGMGRPPQPGSGEPGMGRPPRPEAGQPGARPPRPRPEQPGARTPPRPLFTEGDQGRRTREGDDRITGGRDPRRPGTTTPGPQVPGSIGGARPPRPASPAPPASVVSPPSPPVAVQRPPAPSAPPPGAESGVRPLERITGGRSPRREGPLVTPGPRVTPPSQLEAPRPPRAQFQLPPAQSMVNPPPAPPPPRQTAPPPPPRVEQQRDTSEPQ